MLGGGKGEGGGDAEEDLNGGICGLVRSKGWRCKKIGKLGIGGLDRFFDEVRERERERYISTNQQNHITTPHFLHPPLPSNIILRRTHIAKPSPIHTIPQSRSKQGKDPKNSLFFNDRKCESRGERD